MKSTLLTSLFSIMLVSSCLDRSIVRPNSDEVPKADFVEVQLRTGDKYVLTNVKVYEEYLEGEFRGKTTRINFQDIESVETMNRDYAKVFTYYVIGGAAIIGVLFLAFNYVLFD